MGGNVGFSIGQAKKSDLETLTAVEAICFPKEEAASRETFATRLEAFGNWFFVAKDEKGRIIGMIDGMATDEETIDDAMFENASLHNENGAVQTVFGLDVLPEWRKKGVAGTLMAAFVDAARRAGRKKVTLTCKEQLIGMYEHFGFILIGKARSVHGGAVWFDMDLPLKEGK